MYIGSDAQDKVWDVIIVGTGMGGGTLGYRLAKAGRSVLFCEAGQVSSDSQLALRGEYLESILWGQSEGPGALREQINRRCGRAFQSLRPNEESGSKPFIPFMGAALGGSSALYGMVLERLLPADFSPRACHPRAPADSLLPDHWPIDYGELEPYYAAAERLYQVKGQLDPLKQGHVQENGLETVTDILYGPNQRLFEDLTKKGFHPYRLPLAQKRSRDCTGCQGYLCSRDCKLDSWTACVRAAVKEHGARLLAGCWVTEVVCRRSRAVAIQATRKDQTLTLKADLIVLAAGALQTPAILLRSRGPRGRGLGQRSGLVGAGLMRHCIDIYAVATEGAEEGVVNQKEIGWNDFYYNGTQKLGTIQSFGEFPPLSAVLSELLEGRPALLRAIAKTFPSWAQPRAWLWRKIAGKRLFLAAIMEDLPYGGNRINLAANDEVRLDYGVRSYEAQRVAQFRQKIKDALKGQRVGCLRQAEDNRRIAHACGTCRFGASAEDSVLDRNNRLHELDNLFVVDGSFLPSSGGTNPSLTIAANALRVGEYLLGPVNTDPISSAGTLFSSSKAE